jgi:hypothetical protein
MKDEQKDPTLPLPQHETARAAAQKPSELRSFNLANGEI